MTDNKKLKVISLFSGCGGMDLGFEGGFDILKQSSSEDFTVGNGNKKSWVRLPRTNFEIILANDILPFAKGAWGNYFEQRGSKVKNYKLQSIVDLVKEHKNGSTFKFPSADVVMGGFPCQDFSISGKRKGFNSDKSHHGKKLENSDDATEENRGKLYMWMREVINLVRPKVFIAENVGGLVTLDDVKDIIQKDFENVGCGYHVVAPKVLLAANYGVPQSRERVFFIGYRKDKLKRKALDALEHEIYEELYSPYPAPSHCVSGSNGLKKHVTVRNGLAGLGEPFNSRDPSHQAFSMAKYYGSHCQGQTEVKMNGIGPTIRAEHHGNIEYRRLSAEHGGKNHAELRRGLVERRLSVRECARIQTFPDDYQFVSKPKFKGDPSKVSASDAYKLIGNAVPPLLAYHIAFRLQKIWRNLFKGR